MEIETPTTILSRAATTVIERAARLAPVMRTAARLGGLPVPAYNPQTWITWPRTVSCRRKSLSSQALPTVRSKISR